MYSRRQRHFSANRPKPKQPLIKTSKVGHPDSLPRHLPPPIAQHPREDVLLACNAINEAIQATHSNTQTRSVDRCLLTSLSHFSPEAVAATAAIAATAASEEELIRQLVRDYVPTQPALWQCPICYLPIWEGPNDRTDINSGPEYVHARAKEHGNFFHYAANCQCPCRTEFLFHVFPNMMKVEWFEDPYDDVDWMDAMDGVQLTSEVDPVVAVPKPKELLACPRCAEWIELDGVLGHTGPVDWHPIVRTAHGLHWCTLEGQPSLWCMISADSRLWGDVDSIVMHMVTLAFSPPKPPPPPQPTNNNNDNDNDDDNEVPFNYTEPPLIPMPPPATSDSDTPALRLALPCSLGSVPRAQDAQHGGATICT